MRVLFILLALSQACFAMHELESSESLEHDESFVANWAVAAAFGWALRETSTVYRLRPDGEIEIVRHLEGDYFEGEAGQWFVREPADGTATTCAFGDRWWSAESRLHIESDCTDGRTRVLVLRSVESGNASPSGLEIVGPDGARGFWDGFSAGFAGPGFIRRCIEDCP